MDGSMKHIFVCKSCGIVGTAVSMCYCSKCKTDMSPAPYDPVQWNAVSQETRTRAIEHWRNTGEWADIPGVEKLKAPIRTEKYAGSASTASTSYSSAAGASGWVGLLRTFAYIGLCLGILASLIGGIALMSASGALGAVVLLFGILLSFLSVSGIMVFLDLASDVRAIRRLMERNGR